MPFPTRPRAMITGAASGLGRALALDLARRRARILVADVNGEGADETARLVRDAGGESATIRCDVTRTEDLEAAAARCDELWGGTDILVNNAGVAAAGLVGEQSLDDWKWIVGINLWGVILGCHVFVPRFRKQRSGFVLNVASAGGFVSLPEMASYNVTKAAVISLSETLYTELGGSNVNVSVACPTFFKTGLMDSFRSPDSRQRVMAENFFKRSRATSEEIAAASLRALEAGQLYVVPNADGRLAFALKRFSPGLYFRTMRMAFRTPWAERQLLRRPKPRDA